MTRLVAMCQASVDAYLASAGADVDGIDLHQHVIEIVARNVASGNIRPSPPLSSAAMAKSFGSKRPSRKMSEVE